MVKILKHMVYKPSIDDLIRTVKYFCLIDTLKARILKNRSKTAQGKHPNLTMLQGYPFNRKSV